MGRDVQKTGERALPLNSRGVPHPNERSELNSPPGLAAPSPKVLEHLRTLLCFGQVWDESP